MKIVVGGSYHNPNWPEVKRVMEELQMAGHEILMPAGAEPIDTNAEFIRFEGEEDFSDGEIEQQFLHNVCEEADAFVVVNSNGYLGQSTIQELCKAIVVNLTSHRRFLVYFTEKPTIFQKIEQGIETPIVFPDGKHMKFIGPNELRECLGLNITEEEYDLLYPYHYKLYEIFNNYPGVCKIGISELLESVDEIELSPIPGIEKGRQIF